MTIQDAYAITGSNYSDVLGRLVRDTLVEKFALRFVQYDSFALLKESLANDDCATAFRAAHTLKGVCQNLSFTVLASSASACTEALRAGDLAGGKQLFAQVETDYQALVAALSQVGNG